MTDLFQHPGWLWALAAFLPAAALLHLWAAGRRRRLAAVLGEPATLGRLTPPEAGRRRAVKAALETAAVALLLAALAAPQWGVEMVSGAGRGVHAVIAVDSSLSMTAEDASPSRFAKAKAEALELLDGLKGNRVGLVNFSGAAFVQCPLTTDAEALRSFVEGLRPGAVPQAGSAIESAVDLGTKLLSRYPGHKALILLTDGEDRAGGDPGRAARAARAAGVRVYAVGVGTPEGGPMPIKDAAGATVAYKKDGRGETVVTKLAEPALIRLAAETEGAYFRATDEEAEAEEIVRLISRLEKSRIRSASASRYMNRYRLPLSAGLLLLLAAMLLPERRLDLAELVRRRPAAEAGEPTAGRLAEGQVAPAEGRGAPAQGRGAAARALGRRAAALAVLGLLAAGCGPRQAAGDADIIRGNLDYKSGEFSKALERFTSAGRRAPADARPRFNTGAARYKLDDFDGAGGEFSSIAASSGAPRALRPKAYYNLGNALYRKKLLPEAAEAYKQCLLLDPEEEDCRFNLVKTLQDIKQPPPQKPKPPPQSPPKRQGGGADDKRPQAPDPGKAKPQAGLAQEDAERVLEAVREREKNTARPAPKSQRGKPRPAPEEDW